MIREQCYQSNQHITHDNVDDMLIVQHCKHIKISRIHGNQLEKQGRVKEML